MSRQNAVLLHPCAENRPQFCISRTSIYSIDLKFQYNTSIGKLNQCAKFQKVIHFRSLSSTLHVPSKRCVTTPSVQKSTTILSFRVLPFIQLT